MEFSGTQKFIKQDTGGIVEMNVTEIEERDANFHKVWLGHVIIILLTFRIINVQIGFNFSLSLIMFLNPLYI